MKSRPTLPLLRALALAVTVTATALHAQVPQILNYQGRVAVGSPAINFDGNGGFRFALVNGDGTTVYWANAGDTTPADGVPDLPVELTVAKGLYSVLLGDTAVANMAAIPASVFANSDVRLRVWFDDGTNGVQQLAPDQRIAAVGYAIMAGDVADGAITSAKIAAGAVGSLQLGNNLTLPGTTTGTFSGSGAGLSNVPFTISNGSVTGTMLAGELTLAGTTTGTFSGSGAGLTSLNGAQVTSGTIADARLSSNVVLLDATQTLTNKAITGSFIGPLTGNAATATNFTGALAGDVSGTQGATAISATTVTGKPLTGFASTNGTITGADSVLSAINKLDGNIALKAPLASPNFTGTVTAGNFSGSGAGLSSIPATAVATPPPGMVLIPAGTFTMGDNLDGISEAIPTVSATVSAFYMDTNEVTLSQWLSVYYWAMSNGYAFSAGLGKGPNHPVHSVTWYDAVKWCNARSEQAGKTPVYYTGDAQTTIYKTGNADLTNAQVKWDANGYRLATEAEWEKAARGGRTGLRFPWGNTISQNLANYFGYTSVYSYDLGPNSLNPVGAVGGTSPATSPGGAFASNGYGLNDMSGNLFEWCWDWLGTPYAGGNDPKGAVSGTNRIVRGGGWTYGADSARCAHRNFYTPSYFYFGIGFRTVVTLPQ